MDQWPCFSPSDQREADETTQILCRHGRDSLAVFRTRPTVFAVFARPDNNGVRTGLKRRIFRRYALESSMTDGVALSTTPGQQPVWTAAGRRAMRPAGARRRRDRP